MQLKQLIIRSLAFPILLGLSAASQATIWNIDAVLTASNNNSFNASLFHDANDTTQMTTGGWTALIVSGTGPRGTYNDANGFFDAEFNLVDGGTVSVEGTLLFDGSGALSTLASLEVIFDATAITEAEAVDVGITNAQD